MEAIIAKVEHSPEPRPEGCWPGGHGAGRVEVGFRPYIVETVPGHPFVSLMASELIAFAYGPDGPAHHVQWNGRLTAAEREVATAAAREALRAAAEAV